MANSDAHSIIKALMEKELLVIQHQGLIEWLDRLKSKGEISEQEIDDLLRHAEQLEIYDLPRSEFISSEALPILDGVQDDASLRKFLGKCRSGLRPPYMTVKILREF